LEILLKRSERRPVSRSDAQTQTVALDAPFSASEDEQINLFLQALAPQPALEDASLRPPRLRPKTTAVAAWTLRRWTLVPLRLAQRLSTCLRRRALARAPAGAAAPAEKALPGAAAPAEEAGAEEAPTKVHAV
jgi:hypothetical protein